MKSEEQFEGMPLTSTVDGSETNFKVTWFSSKRCFLLNKSASETKINHAFDYPKGHLTLEQRQNLVWNNVTNLILLNFKSFANVM